MSILLASSGPSRATVSEPTRTDAIITAVIKQLSLRRTVLDKSDDLGEITVVVRLMAGTVQIRSTVVSEHHVNLRQHPVGEPR